mgnify:CR=1 FL=1
MRRTALGDAEATSRPAKNRFRPLDQTFRMDSLDPVALDNLQESSLAQAGPQNRPPQKRTRRQVEPERREGAGAGVASGGNGGG